MSTVKLRQKFWAAVRILSLLLCGGFLLMGVRSCTRTDLVRLTTENRHYEVVTIPWSVRLTVANSWTDPQPLTWTSSGNIAPSDASHPVFGQRPIYRTWYFFGMGIRKDTMPLLVPNVGRKTITYTIFTIPFQMLAFLAFLPMTWRILTIRRRRKLREFRIANSQCISCGYDVRFASDRCPECGERVVRPSDQQAAEM